MKRSTPICSRALLALGASTALSSIALAQAKVPVMALAPSAATSTATFGSILGLRQLPNGSVLVNDAGRRRVLMLDASLTKVTVVIDSTAGTSNSYGPRATPLIAYLGDSSLFVDVASTSLLVIDPKGQVSRVMSAPKPGDLRFMGSSAAYVDDRGRLLYRGAQMVTQNRSLNPGERPAPIQPPDSAPILRADFDTRMVDTVGRVKISSGTRMNMQQTSDGKMAMTMTINPLQVVDDWAVLSDGSLAFVRGQDYHVDVTNPTGSVSRGTKMPFDWKRLTDDDKQKLIDSARTATEASMKAQSANATPGQFTIGGGAGGPPGGGGGEQRVMIAMSGGPGGGGGGGGMTVGGGEAMAGGPPGQTMNIIAPKIDFVPLKEIADYYPAIRNGAAKPDFDGNLWILPTTSAQSQGGELVYDVINKGGELFQRVRVPQGRSIAGFGKGGIVYLMSGDRTKGFVLERTSILGGDRATQ